MPLTVALPKTDTLPDHDAAEITRQPLEDTLLNLRAMLPEEEGLGDLLDEALEPPAPSEVERALQSLMQMETVSYTHLTLPTKA